MKKSDTKSNKAFSVICNGIYMDNRPLLPSFLLFSLSHCVSLALSISLALRKWLNKKSRRFGPFVHPQWAIIKYKVIANIAFIGVFICSNNWPKKGSTNHKTSISLWKHYFYPECIEWHWLYRYAIRIRFISIFCGLIFPFCRLVEFNPIQIELKIYWCIVLMHVPVGLGHTFYLFRFSQLLWHG